MKTQKQVGLFSAPTPKSPLSSFSQASKTMTDSHSNKIFSFFAKKALQSAVNFGIIPTQSQKTTAEPRNSNYLSLAHSTPKACFFMRGLHTPKERLARLSMVACSGKGFALCCVPVIAVFEPVTRYRQKASKLKAVTLEKRFTGVTQMYQFIFAAIRRTDLTNHIQKIRINADSELQARAVLAREFVLVLAGKINLKNDRTFSEVVYA
ncbi:MULTISPECIES: host cell division inhibitor Icd-like protein [unclassified Pasteurella]|uniref:host cell division inhibitor Icd-like protein n=1 Tax=unclassified Pasteurella TaxID=2621516 RepID=UPI001D15FC8D